LIYGIYILFKNIFGLFLVYKRSQIKNSNPLKKKFKKDEGIVEAEFKVINEKD
jgi:hypothetical protein